MFKTITALIVTLVAAIAIGAFQILNLTIDQIAAILDDPNITDTLQGYGALLFAGLMIPYSAAMEGFYTPLVALGVAGFVGGLISKSPLRMLFVSLIALGVFFLAYAILVASVALNVAMLLNTAQNIAIDLGVAFALLFIPGMIGGSMTAEQY